MKEEVKKIHEYLDKLSKKYKLKYLKIKHDKSSMSVVYETR